MLERVYRDIDIHPTNYPYHYQGGTSGDWQSQTKAAHSRSFQPSPPQHPKLKTLPSRNKPQSKLLNYIRLIDQKRRPVCNVDNLLSDTSVTTIPLEKAHQSITRTSYIPWLLSDARVFHRKEYQCPKMAQGIVPQNVTRPSVQYTERLLPCHSRVKTTSMPTDGPYQFLPRRRRLPKPTPDQGVFYYMPHAPIGRRLPSTADPLDRRPSTSDRPHNPSPPKSAFQYGTNVASRDISSVTGKEYSRRKWLKGPQGALTVGEFDGGAPMRPDTRINARYFYMLKQQQVVS